MKTKIWGIIFLLIAGGMAQMCKNRKAGDIDLGALMPHEVNEWKSQGADKIYTEEMIFDYIDGAGEIYRAYNYKKLQARNFIREGYAQIIVDIFDMGEAKNAFGIFTHNLEGENVGIGQDSLYSGGLLQFWKGRYFVSLFAEEETNESKAAVLALGNKVASSINEDGKLPGIIELLPEENLKKNSIRYFYNHLILNYHFFLADDNILNLTENRDAALGTYQAEEGKYWLLLVNYPDEENAVKAYNNFLNVYMPEALEEGILQTENAKWTAVKVKQRLLTIVFDAPSKGAAEELLLAVHK